MKLSDLPPLAGELAGGLFAGIATTPDGTHHAVVLLRDKPDDALPWAAAVKWASGLDAALPARPVAAMLFANVKREFAAAWHWTNEELDGSCAWSQSFDYGYQYYTLKSYEGRARAVRLIQLTA